MWETKNTQFLKFCVLVLCFMLLKEKKKKRQSTLVWSLKLKRACVTDAIYRLLWKLHSQCTHDVPTIVSRFSFLSQRHAFKRTPLKHACFKYILKSIFCLTYNLWEPKRKMCFHTTILDDLYKKKKGHALRSGLLKLAFWNWEITITYRGFCRNLFWYEN